MCVYVIINHSSGWYRDNEGVGVTLDIKSHINQLQISNKAVLVR